MECWKIMKKHFGNKLKLKDVTYHHIEDYYDYLKNTRKNKNITIKHHAVILSPALRLAYRDDLIAILLYSQRQYPLDAVSLLWLGKFENAD